MSFDALPVHEASEVLSCARAERLAALGRVDAGDPHAMLDPHPIQQRHRVAVVHGDDLALDPEDAPMRERRDQEQRCGCDMTNE
jgi:hypothetical protein